MNTRTALALLTLVLALVPRAARADDGVGAFRVGAGTNLFGWSANDTQVAGGSTHNEGFDVGILSPALTLDLSVQVAPWIAVGALGTGRYSERSQTAPGASAGLTTTALSYDLLAYVEGSFRVEFARPFLRLCGGVQGSDTHAPGPVFSPGMTVTTETSTVEGAFAAMLGAHLFAVESLSISPFVSFIYAAGNGTSGSMLSTTLQGLTLQVGVEILGWIGGEPTRAPADPRW